ncbi:hypothetical protein N431DRAFT_413025 [Stipitochalara longipes BDJ]|nr:hypothetical protein N431DRAFT_413025 [Stipitochalara longipes BDJ]
MRNILLSIVAFLALALTTEAAAPQCFYPDGVTVEPNHTPCNTTQVDSACCLPQDSCTAQGLCLGTSNFNYRGSCTDKSWQSNSCPQTCRLDPFTKQPFGAQTPIISCSGPGAIPNEFCCNSVGKNCCTVAPFGLGSTGNAFSHGLDQLVLNLKNANNGISSSASSSSTQASSAKKPATKPSTPLSIASTVGLAIGIPLGALVLGVLGFLFWREKRRATPKISRSGIIVDPGKRAYFEPGPPPKPPVDVRKSSTWGSSRSNSRSNTMRDMPIIPERPRTGNRPAGVRVDLI